MHKHTKNTLIIIIIVVVLFSFFGCTNQSQDYQKYSYQFFGTFDTIVQVIGYTKNQDTFDTYSSYAYDRYFALHKLYDIYNNYEGINNLKTVNDNAGIAPVKVDSAIIRLITFSIDANRDISQKVNIALGPVLDVWHTYRTDGIENPKSARIPPMDALQEQYMLSDIDNIIIDYDASTVLLKEKGMRLDVGAIAKGYASQMIAQELIDLGFSSFLLSAGGNVKTVGKPLDDNREYWGVGLQNPAYFDDTKANLELIDTAFVQDLTVVSSGDYQRFYEVDGIRYHHLIDPHTLMPATYHRAVTIFAEDSGYADFLSTAVFLMPYDTGRNLVEKLDGVDAFWVLSDGSVKATTNAMEMLKILGGATNE